MPSASMLISTSSPSLRSNSESQCHREIPGPLVSVCSHVMFCDNLAEQVAEIGHTGSQMMAFPDDGCVLRQMDSEISKDHRLNFTGTT